MKDEHENLRGRPNPREQQVCCRCHGTSEWYGNDGQYGPIKCDPCPAPEPEYNEKGWLIKDEDI